MSDSQQQNGNYQGAGEPLNAKRKRRQKPKQEPLAYAFRGARIKKKPNNHQQQQGSLGSGYALVQMHPHTSAYNNNNQQGRPRQLYSRTKGNTGRHQQRQQQYQGAPMQKAGNNYGYSSIMSTGNNYQASQGHINMRPPFGMPTIRSPAHPRQMHVTPMMTFDQVIR